MLCIALMFKWHPPRPNASVCFRVAALRHTIYYCLVIITVFLFSHWNFLCLETCIRGMNLVENPVLFRLQANMMVYFQDRQGRHPGNIGFMERSPRQ